MLNSIDPTGPIFKGHHQPLDVWILYLCFMGLNLSKHDLATQRGSGDKEIPNPKGILEFDELYVIAGHTGNLRRIAAKGRGD